MRCVLKRKSSTRAARSLPKIIRAGYVCLSHSSQNIDAIQPSVTVARMHHADTARPIGHLQHPFQTSQWYTFAVGRKCEGRLSSGGHVEICLGSWISTCSASSHTYFASSKNMTLSEHATGMTFAVLPCTEGPAAPDFELPSQSVVNLENIPSCSKYLYESYYAILEETFSGGLVLLSYLFEYKEYEETLGLRSFWSKNLETGTSSKLEKKMFLQKYALFVLTFSRNILACVGTQNGRPDSQSPGTDTFSYTPIEGTGTPY